MTSCDRPKGAKRPLVAGWTDRTVDSYLYIKTATSRAIHTTKTPSGFGGLYTLLGFFELCGGGMEGPIQREE
jgi:hypothetical protein